MKLSERVLLALSREPNSPDLITDAQSEGVHDESSLQLLEREYPNIYQIIHEKNVVDFGCGEGFQSVALAKGGAARVVGVDSNLETLSAARAMLRGTSVQECVEFVETLPAETLGSHDVIISQNSMEHFHDPESVLELMLAALKPGGKLLITFGPPWYAPYGSHMNFFTKVPWVNILFSEKTVMSVRSRFRDDGARRYDEVESGLNQMSVRKFEQIVSKSSLPCSVTYRKYECVKGLNFLRGIPVLREMFINHITCTLQKYAT